MSQLMLNDEKFVPRLLWLEWFIFCSLHTSSCTSLSRTSLLFYPEFVLSSMFWSAVRSARHLCQRPEIYSICHFCTGTGEGTCRLRGEVTCPRHPIPLPCQEWIPNDWQVKRCRCPAASWTQKQLLNKLDLTLSQRDEGWRISYILILVDFLGFTLSKRNKPVFIINSRCTPDFTNHVVY